MSNSCNPRHRSVNGKLANYPSCGSKLGCCFPLSCCSVGKRSRLAASAMLTRGNVSSPKQAVCIAGFWPGFASERFNPPPHLAPLLSVMQISGKRGENRPARKCKRCYYWPVQRAGRTGVISPRCITRPRTSSKGARPLRGEFGRQREGRKEARSAPRLRLAPGGGLGPASIG